MRQGLCPSRQSKRDLADVLTDATAVIGGKGKHKKRFQHAQAVTDRVRAAHPHANITAIGHSLGGTLAQDTMGTNKQITFNKGTSLHDMLYRRRKSAQTNGRKTGDVISVLSHFQRGKIN
jgi:putative lipase involved disintegration of autophagic bodies